MQTTVPHLITPRVEERFLYGRASAAAALDLSVRQIDYLIEKGELRTIRTGKRILIPREELVAFSQRGYEQSDREATPA